MNSKKNSCRGNYMRKYGILILTISLEFEVLRLRICMYKAALIHRKFKVLNFDSTLHSS